MKIRPIRSKKDYQEALREIDRLIDSRSKAAKDRLEVIATLVEAYEDKHHAIPAPDPMEAIKFRMEQKGFARKDLAKLLGIGLGRVSELLSGKRKLTVAMIRTLHKEWKIPLTSLIGVEADAA